MKEKDNSEGLAECLASLATPKTGAHPTDKYPFIFPDSAVPEPSFRILAMSCRLCTSENQCGFLTEIAIHLPGSRTPHIFFFPQVVVGMDCGFTEFSIPEGELQSLVESDQAGS